MFRAKFFILIWVILIAFFGTVVSFQLKDYGKLEKEKADVISKIEEEKKLTEQLKSELLISSSDKYVEKVAREQLGLVKPDEYLFINDDSGQN